MKYALRLHPDVIKYLYKLDVTEKNNLIESIKLLSINPCYKRSRLKIN